MKKIFYHLFLVLFLCFFNLVAHAQSIQPFPAYIKPGAILTRLSDNKSFVSDVGLFVKVKEIHPTKRDLFNVYNKKGELVYTVQPQYITEISEDIRVYPKVNAEVIYPPRSKLKNIDDSFNFNTQLNLHISSLDPSAFNSFYQAADSSANLTRFELRSVYQTQLPVNFGLTAGFQYGTWFDTNNEKVKMKNFSIGPIVEYNYYQRENLNFKAILSGEFSPLYQTSSLASKEDYSSLIFQIGTEVNYLTTLGTFNFGIHYRNQSLNINSSTLSSAGVADEDISINNLGIVVGYILNWTL